MTALVATRSVDPEQRPAGGHRPDRLRYADDHFVLDASPAGADVAIGPNLVLAVIGRIDDLPALPRMRGQRTAQELLAVWQSGAPNVLRGAAGDFVVVCYDRVSTRLSVVRDIVGAVPAYLVGGRRQTVTTSLACALAAVGSPTVDPHWTRSYLAGRWPDAGHTPYREITLLPPGAMAVAERSSWRLDPFDEWRWVEDVPRGTAESAERFRGLFDDAVRRRLVHAGGTAVTTSGGLDSSSVLVSARHVAPERPLIALALRFTDARGDERAFQEAVARAAGARLEWIEPDETPGPFGTGPDALLEEHSGPPLIGNWFLHAGLRCRAAELGIGRVLDGEDGDGVAGGDPLYLADLLAGGRLFSWALETAALSRAGGGDVRALARRALGQAWSAWREGVPGRLQERSTRGLVQGGYLSSVTAESYRMWEGLAGGVGHPFLDRRLMEYALAMPAAQRMRRGRSKIVLRAAMGGRLHHVVATRTDKANLAHPFVSALEGPQRQILTKGLALARRRLTGVDHGTVPDLTVGMSPENLYRAYRYACVGYWLTRFG